MSEHDPVNHPSHYTQGGIECIDAIESALGEEGFISFLQGQVIKYAWRCRIKAGVEDVRKGIWYANRLVETMKRKDEREKKLHTDVMTRVSMTPHNGPIEQLPGSPFSERI